MQEESGKNDHGERCGAGDDRTDVCAGQRCAEELERNGEDIARRSATEVEPPFAAVRQSWPLDEEEDHEQGGRACEPQDDEVEKGHAGQGIATDHKRAAPDGSRSTEVEQPPGVALRWVHWALSGGLELDSLLGWDTLVEVVPDLDDLTDHVGSLQQARRRPTSRYADRHELGSMCQQLENISLRNKTIVDRAVELVQDNEFVSLFHERIAGDVQSPLCLRLVQGADRFLGHPVVQTRLDNLEARQIGDTFQFGVSRVALHELDEQDALSGSDGPEAETQRRSRLPLAVACVHHHQTMLFHCRLHCRDVIYSIVLPSFPRMRESILSPTD